MSDDDDRVSSQCRITSKTRTVLVVPLDLDLSTADFEVPITGVPFMGSWSIEGELDDDGDVTVALFSEHCPVGSVGRDTSVRMSLYWVDVDGVKTRLARASWVHPKLFPDTGRYHTLNLTQDDLKAAAKVSNGRFKPSKHRSYSLKIRFAGRAPLQGAVTPQALTHARLVAPQVDSPLAPDVCLRFPRTNNLRLYTQKSLLTRASPYFKDLFSSGFSESISEPSSKRRRLSGTSEKDGSNEDFADFEDSDDEIDEHVSQQEPPLPASPPPSLPSNPIHEITITETAYSTYRAVLLYLHTGYIDWALPALPEAFARGNSLSSSNERLSRAQEAKLAAGIDVDPVSAKCVFRLSHLLELSTLQHLALSVFDTCLLSSSVAYELVCPTVCAYDDLRRVVVKYIASHFEEVEKSNAWKEVMSRIKAGELSRVAPALAELHEARSKQRRREEGGLDSNESDSEEDSDDEEEEELSSSDESSESDDSSE